MFAPIYKTISTAAVKAIVGSQPRIYGSGLAPQGVTAPYITWFVVVGQPYDHLSGPPGADNDSIQIDCWAGPGDDQELVCINLAKARARCAGCRWSSQPNHHQRPRARHEAI